MLEQAIDLLLEKPEKLERLLLLFLKSLLTIWGLNLIIVYFDPLFFCGFINSENLLNFEFVKTASPLKLACYVVTIILFWIMIWEIFANWILPNLCKLFVWITLQKLIFDLIGPGISYLEKLFQKKTQSDEFQHQINRNYSSGVSRLINQLYDQNRAKPFVGSLYIFHIINVFSQSYAGSAVLYAIIKHKKTDFVKGRILGYYTIVLILFIAIGILKPHFINWVYVILIVVLAYIAVFIAAMKDVLQDIDSNNIIDLKLLLKHHIYVDMVDETIRQHRIAKYFKCHSLRKRFVMTRVAVNNEVYCDYPRKKIKVIRLRTREKILTSEFFETFNELDSENVKFIVVSNMIPNEQASQFIKENGIIYISAKNEKQLYFSLDKATKVLSDWIELKPL